MTAAWWLITSATAFGWAVTLIPIARPLGAHRSLDICREPMAALTVQAVVLWLAGTTVTGTCLSFAAGLAAMAIVMKLRGRQS